MKRRSKKKSVLRAVSSMLFFSIAAALVPKASAAAADPVYQSCKILNVWKISQPIETRYGYHLVRVIKRSDNSFEDARPHVVILLKSQMVDQQIEAMRKAQPVTLNPAFFGNGTSHRDALSGWPFPSLQRDGYRQRRL
ncbi:foldase protein PrsA [Rhizobium mongolense]